MGYVTVPEYKKANFPDGVIDTVEDIEIQRAIDTASRQIDFQCGRKFTLDASDQTHLFYPFDGIVHVTDLVTVTSIKTDTRGDRSYATELASTDYELLPARNLDGETRYQRIRIWPTSSKSFASDRLVQVVGKFGYVVSGTTPADIKLATLLLAHRLMKRHDVPFGVLSNDVLGGFTRVGNEDADVRAILDPYMRSREWVIA